MATILYFNGFDSGLSKNASDHDLAGTTVIEVWSELQVFETQRARRNYFRNSPVYHVMTISHEEIDGEKKWMFLFDDGEQSLHVPLSVLPSDADLEVMLQDLINQ